MFTIVINDVIGYWDMDDPWLREKLTAAGGADIRVEISSPGGFVFEGLVMFNLLKNYSGKVHTHLMGLAASMASYLALAGDKITAEDNAIYMIHNARGWISGDHKDFEKYSKYLNSVNDIVAREYSKKTGTKIKDIRKMMDEETYFFGKEIKEAGFIDEVVETSPENITIENKTDGLVYAKINIEESFNKMEKFQKENNKNDSDKLAAWLKIENNFEPTNKIESRKPNLDNGAGKNIEGEKKLSMKEAMEKLKNDNPALCNYIIAQGMAQGDEKEWKRVKAHLALGKKTKAFDLMHECIENKSSIMDEDVQAKYLVAGMNSRDLENRDGDNPGAVTTPDGDDKDAIEDKIMDAVDAEMGINTREVN